MLRFICFLFLASAFVPLSAQRVKFNKGKVVQKKYNTSIPYELVRGKLIIPAQVDGQTLRLIFDTGAPNIISYRSVDQLRTEALGSISVRDANDQNNRLEVIRLPLMALGGVEFKNVPAILTDEDSDFIFACFKVDGILGSNLLRKSVVEIRPEEKSIALTHSVKSLPSPKVEPLQMQLNNSQSSPYISISLGEDKRMQDLVLFDTGMNDFYDLSSSLYEKMDKADLFLWTQQGEGATSIGLFGTAEKGMNHRVSFDAVHVGGAKFKQVRSESTDASRSRIGTELLKYGKVILDYPKEHFYFIPDQAEFLLDDAVFDLSPAVGKEEIVVGILWDEALDAQIDTEDQILQIDEIDLRESDPCDFVTRDSPFKHRDELKVLIWSKQEQKELELQLERKRPLSE